MYERIFITEKHEWITSKNEIEKFVLNNHAKKLALENDEESVEVSVALEIEDKDDTIEIKRVYEYEFVNKGISNVTSDLLFRKIDSFSGKHIVTEHGMVADNYLRELFSDYIRDYILFKGEDASKIIKLEKGSQFTLAVEEIAKLKDFEKAKNYAEKYVDSVNRKITRQTNKSNENKKLQERFEEELTEKQKEREKYDKKYNEAKCAKEKYFDEISNLEKELEGYKEFEEYLKKEKDLKAEKQRIEGVEKTLNVKKEISETAVFYKVREKIESFKDFYKKLEEKGKVPPSIPAAEIKKALECCRCTICNADLSEGTAGRRFAEARLPKCNTDALGAYLRELNSTMSFAFDDIIKTPESLNNLLGQKRTIDEQKRNFLKRKSEIETILQKIKASEGSSEDKERKIKQLKDTLSRKKDCYEKVSKEAARAEALRDAAQREIDNIKKSMRELIHGDTEIGDSEKIKLRYAENLSTAMKKIYELCRTKSYAKIEERTNEYYKEMTEQNDAIIGELKIDADKSDIYTVDEKGERIRNINQGNQISIQLAVIAGILSVVQEQFWIQYPFISDGVLSDLGGDNKLSVIKTMVNAFEQLIIILKDDNVSKSETDYDEIRELIKCDKDIEAAYELKLSEADAKEDLYTVIEKIK